MERSDEYIKGYKQGIAYSQHELAEVKEKLHHTQEELGLARNTQNEVLLENKKLKDKLAYHKDRHIFWEDLAKANKERSNKYKHIMQENGKVIKDLKAQVKRLGRAKDIEV